jgi:ATP-dependent Lon protease
MTNSSFQDRFFQEITFPLNKVIFIFSFNDISKIDKILLDRLEVIDVESYSIKEKIAALQVDKDKKTICLYTNNPEEQFSFVKKAKEKCAKQWIDDNNFKSIDTSLNF